MWWYFYIIHSLSNLGLLLDKMGFVKAAVPMTVHSNRIRYGKRGISWHSGCWQRVVSGEDGQPKLATQTHISVLDDDSDQDSETVLALMKESILLYAKGHPEVKTIHVRSDNAGKFVL